MSADWIAAGVAVAYLAGEVFLTLAARARWAHVGVGIRDDESGAFTLGAVPVDFSPMQEIAHATESHLVLALVALGPHSTVTHARLLHKRMRENELLIRVDYDRFAALLLVASRLDAVRATVRLTEGWDDDSMTRHRIGFASSPEDGFEFFDLLDRSSERLAPLQRVRDVAQLHA